MQIFKNILLACSLAVATSPLYLKAEDNEAQAAARAALQQKMRELKGLPPAAESQPAPSAPVEVVAPKAPEPVATPPPHPAATIALPEGASADLIEQARQATRARVAELQGKPSASISAVPEAPAAPGGIPAYVPEKTSKEAKRAAAEQEAAAKKAAQAQAAAARKAAQEQAAMEKAAAKKAADERAAAEKAAADQATQTPMATSGTAPDDTAKVSAEKQKAAKAQAEADAKARAAADKAAKAAKKAKPQANKMEAAVPLAPLEGPASSLPSSKEQRLQQLTEQYKADKISAADYHEQRAKIIAEP